MMTQHNEDNANRLNKLLTADAVHLTSGKNTLLPILLLILTGIFYYSINSTITPINNWPSLKFSANDSATYLEVGKWLLHEKQFSEVKMSIATRPFLYPLLVVLLEKIHPWAIIFFQYFLWQSQIFLIFFSAKIISHSVNTSFLLALCSASLLSPIAISLHVLTETTASFLLILSVFLLIKYFKNKDCGKLLFLYLLSLSLCSVIRPSYFYIFLINIPFSFIIWKNKKLKGALIALLIFIPILFQYSIMKKNFNIYKLSIIDTIAFNDYFLSALELYKRNLEYSADGKKIMVLMRDLRRKSLKNTIEQEGYQQACLKIKMELFRNLLESPSESLDLFTDYIQANAREGSTFLSPATKEQSSILFTVSCWQSNFLMYLNIFSASVVVCLVIVTTVRKTFSATLTTHFLPINFAVGTLITFTYVSSGVSGFQGDRLIMPIFFISFLWFFYQLNTIFTIYNKRVSIAA